MSLNNNDVPCPDCPPYGKSNRRPMLENIEDNYSGTSADVGQCPLCKKAWWITYTAVVGERAEEWEDGE